MSQERVLKTLINLGLTRLDSQVYICLAKRGPKKGQDISRALKVQKQPLYRSLRHLQSKGIVSATLEHPSRFSAVSFDKVIDLFIKTKMGEAHRIEEDKNQILASWQSMAVGETIDTSAKFTVIEGRAYIYSKIKQMIEETKSQLSTISTVVGLVRADQFGLFDAALDHPLKSKIQFRFLTELSEQNLSATKTLLSGMTNAKFNFEVRTPDLGLSLFPRMVIRDKEETIFFITPSTDTPAAGQDDVCLWTNCKVLAQAFLAVFEDLWRNSTGIQKKIAETETKNTEKSEAVHYC